MGFDAHARAARDVAFATLGQWVAIYSVAHGRIERQAIPAGEDREMMFGDAAIVSPGAVWEFRAEDAPRRGETVAVLDGAGGPEIERRVVDGEPVTVDRWRLKKRVTTVPA